MIYSQFSEDVITRTLIQKYNPPHVFLEIGCGDGRENNTRMLVEDYHWGGLWIDANPKNIEAANKLHLPGVLRLAMHVTLDNALIINLKLPQEIGVLSLDIDGNDWWIWRDLWRHGLRPYICIIEAQIQKPGYYVMPYKADYMWDPSTPPDLEQHNCGASVEAMVELGREMGYNYVGKCPDAGSPNLFFVRKDLDPT